MRPSSLRRFGIAAVAGGLLLASGTVPTFGDDATTADLPPGSDDALDGLAPTGIDTADPLADTDFLDRVRAIWVAVTQWNANCVPLPAGIIVDDGAPF